jgi:hypothetical protein
MAIEGLIAGRTTAPFADLTRLADGVLRHAAWLCNQSVTFGNLIGGPHLSISFDSYVRI